MTRESKSPRGWPTPGFTAGILIGSTLTVLFARILSWLWNPADELCQTVGAGQQTLRQGTECYVRHQSGALEPVRWKP